MTTQEIEHLDAERVEADLIARARACGPTELSGGATIRQLAMVQRELAAHRGSTASPGDPVRHQRRLPHTAGTEQRRPIVSTSRIHLASNVGGLDAATRFSTDLFAVDPGEQRTGYANVESHEPRDARRLDARPRSILKGIGLVATALAVAGAFAVAAGDLVLAADDSLPIAAAAPADDDCGQLWDRVRVLGLPEASWEPVATALGLTPRGAWISADGLTWEHLDGTTVVVANPRSATESPQASCATGVDADGRSRA